MTRITVIALIVAALFAFGSLVAGAEYLEWLLPGGLPLGNALTAIGFTASALAGYGVSQPNSIPRWCSIVSLVLSITWLPISVGLAGNLSLNFGDQYGPLWFRLSIATFVFALISLIYAILQQRQAHHKLNAS